MSTAEGNPIIPIEFSGLWIAWNFDETKILASGSSYSKAKRSALATGEPRPVLVKAPPANSARRLH
jgi:hypothetical protein